MKPRFIVTAMCLVGASGLALAEYQNTARDLAATCANCHGTNGHSVGGSDSLAGVPAANTLQKLKEFRDGDRPATIMHQIAKGYTEEQLKLVADYFAAQK
ncbi:MAG: c-type cytochrome [Zoogloeaceae bacterium]|nr:c-type cytochrome [Zoogloeaceae bacterium]